MLKPFYMSADFKQKTQIREPIVTQYDDLIFVVTVFDNGDPAIIDDLSYKFVSRRPDNKSYYVNGVKTGDNEITFDLGKTEVSLIGKVNAAIQLFDANMQRLSSFTFNYTVTEDISLSEELTSQELTLLEYVVQEGPALVDYFKEAKPLVEQFTDYVNDLSEKADKTYVDTKFGNMGNTKTFKGSCLFASLPTSGNTVDDYWYVTDKTTNYCWNGTAWVDIGNNVNLGDGSVTAKTVESSVLEGIKYPFQPNADFYNKPEVKKAIKWIELYGADANAQYYISMIYRNRGTTPVWSIIVKRVSDTVTVCQFNVANYTEQTGIDLVTLSEVGGSGISGKVWIDWRQLLLDTYSPWTYNNGGLNVSTYRNMTIQKLRLKGVVPNYTYPFQDDATYKNYTAIKNAIKDIRLYNADPTKQYSISLIYKNYSNVYTVRVSEVTGQTIGVTVCQFNLAISSYTLPTGIDRINLDTVGNSNVSGKVWIDWSQIPDGSNFNTMAYNETGLHIYTYTELNPLEKVEISLPPTVYGVVGHEINIYFDNVIKCNNLNNYQLDVTCNLGKQQKERWTAVPTVAGTYTFTLYVLKNGADRIAIGTTNIVVKDIGVGNGINKKGIIIGDSTTDQHIYVDELVNLFNSDVMDITLLGTRGVAPSLHEGRAGWAAIDYCTKSSYNGLTNAFWNGTTFDFSYYMTQTGFTLPDYVVINLGINDIARAYTVSGILGYYDTIINSIKTYNANIKIGLALTIPPASQDAFGHDSQNGTTAYQQKSGVFALVQQLLSRYASDSRIFFIPINTNLDTVNNMQTEQVQVNSRNTTLITRQSNNVHPGNSGYYQEADVFYYTLKSFES
jgi:hypothetical protein